MATIFGKFCRKLRIEKDETLQQMATKLNVTSGYLSLVENGKRSAPAKWEQSLVELYELEVPQQKILSKIMLLEPLSKREKHALYEVLNVLQTDVNDENKDRLQKAARSLLGEKFIENEDFVVNEWLGLLGYLKA